VAVHSKTHPTRPTQNKNIHILSNIIDPPHKYTFKPAFSRASARASADTRICAPQKIQHIQLTHTHAHERMLSLLSLPFSLLCLFPYMLPARLPSRARTPFSFHALHTRTGVRTQEARERQQAGAQTHLHRHTYTDTDTLKQTHLNRHTYTDTLTQTHLHRHTYTDTHLQMRNLETNFCAV